MTSWTAEQLAAIATPDEIHVAPDRSDGTPGPLVIIWVVQHAGDVYARSARGPQGAWYRRAMASGRGRIQVDGVDYPVRFLDAAGDADHAALDAAYHAKYDRYGARVVGPVVGDAAHAVTVRIEPAE